MNPLKSILVSLLFLASGSVSADIISFDLTTNHYGYEDNSTSCSHEYWISSVGLNLHVKDGRVQRAVLRSYQGLGSLMPDHLLEFKAKELEGFELQKAPGGSYWIKILPLSGRLLRWVMNETSTLYCSPPNYSNLYLASTMPNSVAFHFLNVPTPPDTRAFSETINFTGYRNDGIFYRASLGFMQQQK